MSDEEKPGKPSRSGLKEVDRVHVIWDPPKQLLQQPVEYEVRYKDVSDGQSSRWIRHKDRLSTCTLELENLPSCAKFVFQVRMVNEDEEGPYSEQSDEIETIPSAASRMLPILIDIKKKNSFISVKGLPFTEDKDARDEDAKTRKLVLDTESRDVVNEKIIMILGPTGAGKSTLVDGMINYIFGISWRDSFRLTVERLEDDEKLNQEDQALSQTTWITCYTLSPIEGTRIPYKLTIIDTPGYGDVRGIEADKGITEQIRQLFTATTNKGILTLDAVCFVIKASDARLSPAQLYIFNSILSVFQKDIIENFCMLLTFADGKKPPALDALKAAKLPHEEYFCFNNSTLFAANSGIPKDELDRSMIDWNMGQKGFKQLFEALNKLSSKSLALSKEILNERKNIEITIENMTVELNASFETCKSLQNEYKMMTEYDKEMAKNKNFTYTEEEKYYKSEYSNHQNLNCLACNMTCHKNCWSWNMNLFIRTCEVFSGGYCTQCPGKCSAERHTNEKYLYIWRTRKVEKTYEDIEKRYEEAEKKKLSHVELVAKMKHSLEKSENEIQSMFDTIVRGRKRLQEIALRDDPLSAEDLYDIRIKEEEVNKKDGWQERTNLYMKFKAEAKRKAVIEDEAKLAQQKLREVRAQANT